MVPLWEIENSIHMKFQFTVVENRLFDQLLSDLGVRASYVSFLFSGVLWTHYKSRSLQVVMGHEAVVNGTPRQKRMKIIFLVNRMFDNMCSFFDIDLSLRQAQLMSGWLFTIRIRTRGNLSTHNLWVLLMLEFSRPRLRWSNLVNSKICKVGCVFPIV